MLAASPVSILNLSEPPEVVAFTVFPLPSDMPELPEQIPPVTDSGANEVLPPAMALIVPAVVLYP